MKKILFVNESEHCKTVLAQLSQEIYDTNLLLVLLKNLHRIDFESQKDVVKIFNCVLNYQTRTCTPTVDYICITSDIVFTLCQGKAGIFNLTRTMLEPHHKIMIIFAQ